MAPYKERPITKMYHTIGEVAAMFGENTSLIRFWEKEFDILQPKKNKKGNRLFTEKDVENLKLIHHLVKERGYTLAGVKKKLTENRSETVNTMEVVERLRTVRGFLVELRDSL
jgi:DNA-binding transcriptional MerR regulator